MDQAVYVREAIESLIHEGVIGAILVAIMILIFLGNWRMTVIATISIPVSLRRRDYRHLRHRQHDQRDDARRAGVGHRSVGRRRHRGAGEHASQLQPGQIAQFDRRSTGRSR